MIWCCRYDSFILILSCIFYKYILLNENNIDFINKLIEFAKDIKSMSKTVFKNGICDYLIKLEIKITLI